MSTLVIVDDDDTIRRLLRRMLTHLGHVVVDVEDGQRAAALCREMAVDLVVADMHMPHLSGAALVAVLRELTVPPRVLITSGSCAGIDGLSFLSKPFVLEELRRAVDEALQGPDVRQALGAT